MTQQTLEIEKAAGVLKLLGDKTRLTMIKMLSSHDCCVCEFTAIFQASQPAISQHIRKLKDAGIVSETRRGQWIMYSLNKNCEYTSLIDHLLKHIPDQDDKIKELEEKGLRITCS
ncbi:metalloregulator ArsR/SmtB family transcription factor [Bacillus lacus]|uniref:Metalloregulator ArsR/SmtB family transcription factor n=1 Tax=Metabacillus lacus TaxID=1983721 RepID=A0A7X2IVV5_9BACI|nr:metalloregulator ArsR/SmtB family transcription factor [Metabacillus lacus]MRX70742.1 metalloregulator ArsR/SmtB family transcription factor [Metabacillus lacus]